MEDETVMFSDESCVNNSLPLLKGNLNAVALSGIHEFNQKSLEDASFLASSKEASTLASFSNESLLNNKTLLDSIFPQGCRDSKLYTRSLKKSILKPSSGLNALPRVEARPNLTVNLTFSDSEKENSIQDSFTEKARLGKIGKSKFSITLNLDDTNLSKESLEDSLALPESVFRKPYSKKSNVTLNLNDSFNGDASLQSNNSHSKLVLDKFGNTFTDFDSLLRDENVSTDQALSANLQPSTKQDQCDLTIPQTMVSFLPNLTMNDVPPTEQSYSNHPDFGKQKRLSEANVHPEKHTNVEDLTDKASKGNTEENVTSEASHKQEKSKIPKISLKNGSKQISNSFLRKASRASLKNLDDSQIEEESITEAPPKNEDNIKDGVYETSQNNEKSKVPKTSLKNGNKQIGNSSLRKSSRISLKNLDHSQVEEESITEAPPKNEENITDGASETSQNHEKSKVPKTSLKNGNVQICNSSLRKSSRISLKNVDDSQIEESSITEAPPKNEENIKDAVYETSQNNEQSKVPKTSLKNDNKQIGNSSLRKSSRISLKNVDDSQIEESSITEAPPKNEENFTDAVNETSQNNEKSKVPKTSLKNGNLSLRKSSRTSLKNVDDCKIEEPSIEDGACETSQNQGKSKVPKSSLKNGNSSVRKARKTSSKNEESLAEDNETTQNKMIKDSQSEEFPKDDVFILDSSSSKTSNCRENIVEDTEVEEVNMSSSGNETMEDEIIKDSQESTENVEVSEIVKTKNNDTFVVEEETSVKNNDITKEKEESTEKSKLKSSEPSMKNNDTYVVEENQIEQPSSDNGSVQTPNKTEMFNKTDDLSSMKVKSRCSNLKNNDTFVVEESLIEGSSKEMSKMVKNNQIDSSSNVKESKLKSSCSKTSLKHNDTYVVEDGQIDASSSAKESKLESESSKISKNDSFVEDCQIDKCRLLKASKTSLKKRGNITLDHSSLKEKPRSSRTSRKTEEKNDSRVIEESKKGLKTPLKKDSSNNRNVSNRRSPKTSLNKTNETQDLSNYELPQAYVILDRLPVDLTLDDEELDLIPEKTLKEKDQEEVMLLEEFVLNRRQEYEVRVSLPRLEMSDLKNFQDLTLDYEISDLASESTLKEPIMKTTQDKARKRKSGEDVNQKVKTPRISNELEMSENLKTSLRKETESFISLGLSDNLFSSANTQNDINKDCSSKDSDAKNSSQVISLEVSSLDNIHESNVEDLELAENVKSKTQRSDVVEDLEFTENSERSKTLRSEEDVNQKVKTPRISNELEMSENLKTSLRKETESFISLGLSDNLFSSANTQNDTDCSSKDSDAKNSSQVMSLEVSSLDNIHESNVEDLELAENVKSKTQRSDVVEDLEFAENSERSKTLRSEEDLEANKNFKKSKTQRSDMMEDLEFAENSEKSKTLRSKEDLEATKSLKKSKTKGSVVEDLEESNNLEKSRRSSRLANKKDSSNSFSFVKPASNVKKVKTRSDSRNETIVTHISDLGNAVDSFVDPSSIDLSPIRKKRRGNARLFHSTPICSGKEMETNAEKNDISVSLRLENNETSGCNMSVGCSETSVGGNMSVGCNETSVGCNDTSVGCREDVACSETSVGSSLTNKSRSKRELTQSQFSFDLSEKSVGKTSEPIEKFMNQRCKNRDSVFGIVEKKARKVTTSLRLPKLYKPAKWINKKFYDHLFTALTPKYRLEARKVSEEFALFFHNSFLLLKHGHTDAKQRLKVRVKQLGLCQTELDFSFFMMEYAPFEFRKLVFDLKEFDAQTTLNTPLPSE